MKLIIITSIILIAVLQARAAVIGRNIFAFDLEARANQDLILGELTEDSILAHT